MWILAKIRPKNSLTQKLVVNSDNDYFKGLLFDSKTASSRFVSGDVVGHGDA